MIPDDVVIAQRKRITSVTGRITLDTGAVVSFAIGTEELKAAGQNYCIAHNTLPESAAQEDCNTCIPLVHTLEAMMTANDAQYMRMYLGDYE